MPTATFWISSCFVSVTMLGLDALAQDPATGVRFEILDGRIDKGFLLSKARRPDGRPFRPRADRNELERKEVVGQPGDLVFTGTGRHLVVGDRAGHLFAVEVARKSVIVADAPRVRGNLGFLRAIGNGVRDQEVLLTTRFFRLDGGEPTALPLRRWEGVWGRPRYSPDGRFLVSASGPDYWSRARRFENHPGGRWFDLATGREKCHPMIVRAAWTPSSDRAICITHTGYRPNLASLMILDREGDVVRMLSAGGSGANDLAVHPGGKHFYLLTSDGLLLVELASGKAKRIAIGGDNLFLIAGRLLLTSRHGILRLFDLSGKELATYEAQGSIYEIAVSPYGHYVAILVTHWVVELLRVRR